MFREILKNNLVAVVATATGVLIGGMLLFAVIRFVNNVDQIRNQTATNTATIQSIVDFLNKAVAAQQQTQPAK
jgi:hypothetical protein